MANIYSICGISDATVRDYLEQISLWPAATSKMLRYRKNAIANQSARICWKSQTYDNALMSKIQQSFASVIVRPAWRTAFLEALIGGSKIHLNRKSRRICRYLSTDGRTSLTMFMAGRITRLSIANFFLPLNYGLQLWKPCATLVENEDCRLKSVNTNTIQSMSSTDLNQLSGFRPLSLLPSRFVLPHFFPSFCISKVAVRDWWRARISDDGFCL